MEVSGVFAEFSSADIEKLFQRLHLGCGQVCIIHRKSSAAHELEYLQNI